MVKNRGNIVAICELKPGLNVADIGAGTGLFARPFAAKVAPRGKIYAVEITKPFLDHIKKTAKNRESRMSRVFSTTTSTGLPPN